MTERKYLLYIPAAEGAMSCEPFGENRTYDVALNDWWGDGSGCVEAEYGFTVHDFKYRAFAENYPKLRRYDYYLLMDSDVEIDTAALNRLFNVADQWRLSLCQAAVSQHGGKTSHQSLFVQPPMRRPWREVQMCEIMMPLFSAEALEICLPTFTENYSGYGLDYWWPRFLAGHKIGVIDSCVATHTRAQSSAGWKLPNGKGPMQELRELMDKYDLRSLG